jgi:hypothetical protein
MIKEQIKNLISEKTARIGVIGLGYVGLPLIVEFALKGFEGVGFEVDAAKVEAINRGESYIVDVPSENLQKCVAAGKLKATTDFSLLNECDVIIICVPTPLRKTKDPDMSYILAAGEEIQKHLRRGQLIILESTTYPGTTDEVLQPMFEEKGFRLDEDFLLAFSPERVDPGNPQFQTASARIRPKRRRCFTRKSSKTSTPSRRRASPKPANCGKTPFAPSISAWPTKWPKSATRSALTPGKSSARRPPNRSALCRFTRDRASAAIVWPVRKLWLCGIKTDGKSKISPSFLKKKARKTAFVNLKFTAAM